LVLTLTLLKGVFWLLPHFFIDRFFYKVISDKKELVLSYYFKNQSFQKELIFLQKTAKHLNSMRIALVQGKTVI
jgi:restriction endonuclease S subunit